MALSDLIKLNDEHKKIGISEERLAAVMEPMRQYVSFWREYPDLFIDFLSYGPGGEDKEDKVKFHFYFYQRVFLRISMRYKYVYACFPRAYSKSFLSVLSLMIKCILYPGSHLFSAAGGKEQSASILQEKVELLCKLIPALHREIDWGRGRTQMAKDHCKYIFKNGSDFENLAARESTRGQRKHGGLLEECVGIDQKALQEILLPLMNVSRRCMDGSTHDEEPLNQSQCYITTSGYRGTFSYQKLIQTLVQMVTQPGIAFIMGGTWRLPVAMGLQSKNFIKDLKNDPTFNQSSFERELNMRLLLVVILIENCLNCWEILKKTISSQA